MIIYNLTTLVSWGIHEEWKEWMINEYLPELMATELFSHHQLVRLMEVDEYEVPTYALQLYLKNSEDFNLYREKYMEHLQEKEKNVWVDYATSFASLIEVIN